MSKTVLFPWKCTACGRTYESNDPPPVGGATDNWGRSAFLCEMCCPQDNIDPAELADYDDDRRFFDDADYFGEEEEADEDWWKKG